MKRGEVWWVEAPRAGQAPPLVLTRDTGDRVIYRCSGRPGDTNDPWDRVRGRGRAADGMPDHCVLSLDNYGSMPKAYSQERICMLGPERM